MYIDDIARAAAVGGFTPVQPYSIGEINEGPFEKIIDATGRTLHYII